MNTLARLVSHNTAEARTIVGNVVAVFCTFSSHLQRCFLRGKVVQKCASHFTNLFASYSTV